jgi:transposase-like protein
MRKCLKCGSIKYVKDGIVQGKQRFKCKKCNYRFTRFTRRGVSGDKKKQAMHLYLEGMGFRAIGRFLGVSNVAVLKWVRNAGEEILKIHASGHNHKQKVEAFELDELMTYIKSKKTLYGYGLLMIEKDKKQYPLKSAVVTRE